MKQVLLYCPSLTLQGNRGAPTLAGPVSRRYSVPAPGFELGPSDALCLPQDMCGTIHWFIGGITGAYTGIT